MDKELYTALKTAYEAEKEGLRAYLGFSKKTDVVAGKNMFVQLALDEVDHLELIERFMETLNEGQKAMKVSVPKGRFSKFMPKATDMSLQKVDKGSLDDEEALKIAMAHEIKARDFYKEQAEKATDPVVKEFFEKIMEVEQKHHDILKAELDFMHQDGFWFDSMEFTLEAME